MRSTAGLPESPSRLPFRETYGQAFRRGQETCAERERREMAPSASVFGVRLRLVSQMAIQKLIRLLACGGWEVVRAFWVSRGQIVWMTQ